MKNVTRSTNQWLSIDRGPPCLFIGIDGMGSLLRQIPASECASRDIAGVGETPGHAKGDGGPH